MAIHDASSASHGSGRPSPSSGAMQEIVVQIAGSEFPSISLIDLYSPSGNPLASDLGEHSHAR